MPRLPASASDELAILSRLCVGLATDAVLIGLLVSGVLASAETSP